MDAFQIEVGGQPDALRRLALFYREGEGRSLLEAVPSAERTQLFTGMGASYHAAWIAAYHAQSLNLRAIAVEAVDLLNYSRSLLDAETQVVYMSQSGQSGEIVPLADSLAATTLIGVTNEARSALAHQANFTLPLVAGDETLIASKTYLNTLAVLWLLVRKWGAVANQDGASDTQILNDVANAVEKLLAHGDKSVAQWLEAFEDKTLLFVGHGPHAATARQAAMMVSEWAKVPALSAGIGAFHHGFIESSGPDMGAVIFAPPGRTDDSAWKLGERMESYGVRVLVVVNGQTCELQERAAALGTFDEYLSPILDIIPVQMYADALAKQRGVPPGFRYLTKVVTQL